MAVAAQRRRQRERGVYNLITTEDFKLSYNFRVLYPVNKQCGASSLPLNDLHIQPFACKTCHAVLR